MPFVSLQFIAFMAIVFAAYFAAPTKWRWVVLLVASYIFYWISSQWLILVMFGQTLVTYLLGRRMAAIFARATEQADGADKKAQREVKSAAKKRASRWMWLGVAANIGTLLFLKYFNFFADCANPLLSLAGVEAPHLGLILPVGLSFYTLQAVAYLVDIKRGKEEADASLPRFMLFMSYFPQILQGPIPRHGQLASQLYEGHAFDGKRASYGAQLIMWGFIKKMVIADRLAIPVNQIFDNYAYYDGAIVFLAAAGYGLQVYADFSGGIDIARGFSQMLGIDMVENFRQPYFTRSIEEFWRRWHITLGAWMRDYIFYPLSLSKPFSKLGKSARKVFGSNVGKKIPPFIANFVVFFLVGFWHGANWTFIVYGIWNGVFIMAGVLLDDRYEAIKRRLHINGDSFGWHLFQVLRSFVICSFGRFFSRADTLRQALRMMRSSVAGYCGFAFVTDGSLLNLGLDTANWFVLCAGLLVLLVVDLAHERGFSFRDAIASQQIVFRWIIYLAAITVPLVFGVYGSGYDAAAFIYQQF